MYWMQWSRSAGLDSGPFLSMILIADSCVRIVIFAMSSMRSRIFGWSSIAHSTAVCAWNSAGKLILNSTFSIT